MNPFPDKLQYSSLDVAIADLRETLPMLKFVRRTMEANGDYRKEPKIYRNTCRAIAFLEDEDRMRKTLSKNLTAEGKVEYRFEQGGKP